MSNPTGDATGEVGTHAVDNPDAPLPTAEATRPAPEGDKQDAQTNSAERRAENLGDVVVNPELTHGVDPFTGEELTLEDAAAQGIPVMVPEGKGDIRRDVTVPSHIQAPPVEQVAPGELSKRNSSTTERVAARSTGAAATGETAPAPQPAKQTAAKKAAAKR